MTFLPKEKILYVLSVDGILKANRIEKITIRSVCLIKKSMEFKALKK